MSWTALIPRRPLRGVAGATRLRRTVQVPIVKETPVLDRDERRALTTVAEFAVRASDLAARAASPSVEVRYDDSPGSDRFLTGDTDTLAVAGSSCDHPAYGRSNPMVDLPAADGRYRLAFCIGVFERHPEPLSLMLELARILEPRGHLYLVAPLIVPECPPGVSSADQRRYGLNYLLDASGFRIEYLESVARSSAYAVIAHSLRTFGQPDRRLADRSSFG